MMTGVGMILGTAAYMSPEQAQGTAVDKRSDIWAFGCVLYEMLTGRRAFEGEDVSDTLAAVLRADPDWGALPPDDAAGRCGDCFGAVSKKTRSVACSDIGDARLELGRTRRRPRGETTRWPSEGLVASGRSWLQLLPSQR